MDFSIAAILAQDAISTGAIYALLALATVLVFSVTRVIFIPQGLIPMPIVLQVIENLKRDKFFTRVILANGMI